MEIDYIPKPRIPCIVQCKECFQSLSDGKVLASELRENLGISELENIVSKIVLEVEEKTRKGDNHNAPYLQCQACRFEAYNILKK